MNFAHELYIIIPKNEQGVRDWEYNVENSGNLAFVELPYEEFRDMCADGAKQAMNSIDGVMFDEYESDFIPADKIQKCLQVLRAYEKHKNGKFAYALKTSLDYGYGVYTEF